MVFAKFLKKLPVKEIGFSKNATFRNLYFKEHFVVLLPQRFLMKADLLLVSYSLWFLFGEGLIRMIN